jgi:hypothetical protein
MDNDLHNHTLPLRERLSDSLHMQLFRLRRVFNPHLTHHTVRVVNHINIGRIK